jgi:hypothetical protein
MIEENKATLIYEATDHTDQRNSRLLNGEEQILLGDAT